MKIKVKEKKYEEVLALPKEKSRKPIKQHFIFRLLLLILSSVDLFGTRFTYKKIGMEKLGKKEPCLILMNHSSFIDLKIASTMLFPRPFNIVCTSDGFVGKNWLMRLIGCIPTKKFVSDASLVKNMVYAVKELRSSVLMYPEASYSFDGTATPLPDSIGRCIKLMGVPVVMIRTYGAFARDPLYNGLRLRKTKVSADMEYVLSPQEIAEKTSEEINDVINKCFDFDNFRWQQENEVRISEPFRAEGLNRVLYKCPHCEVEGKMLGTGAQLICEHCGVKYELTEYGYLKVINGETKFSHVPTWYQWERECVRKEIQDNKYLLDVPVDICMMVNTKCIYRVGTGMLTHTSEGFHLTGCEGQLNYRQKPSASYSLYSDYFWYEIGDVICIGDSKALYYCFPKTDGDIVAKARLATEEMYKLAKQSRQQKSM